MEIVKHIVIILLCCAGLCQGAGWLVDSAARIARRLGVSQLIIGLTVVAFGTSAPEFAVSVQAALIGSGDISVGNVVGSNIFNIGFILGACAVVGAVQTTAALVKRDGIIMLAITAALWLILYSRHISRLEGVLLIAALVLYLLFLFIQRKAPIDEEIPQQPGGWRDGVFFLIGLALIIVGGRFLVTSAEFLAGELGMPPWIIGMTVVAAGTSLPELVVSLTALVKKHHGISAGNLIGSNIFNILGVLGVAAAIRPMTINDGAIMSMTALTGLTVLVLVFMRTGWRVSRVEGLVLFLVSLAIWIFSFGIKW